MPRERDPLYLGLPDRLVELREKSGLQTQDLAYAAGIHPSQWARVEERHSLAPRLGTVERMAAALGASPAWLAFGDEGRPPAPGTKTYAGRCERIGERLRARRQELGLSLRALGERAGIDYVAISKAEKGRVPQVDTCEALAAALGVSPAWLAFGDE